jgi:hypothetical protein
MAGLMLAITDADRTFASELGLFLVRAPDTAAEHDAARNLHAMRVPETWLVRSVITKRRLGSLRFTEVDCLYVIRYSDTSQRIEETVAEALRWIVPTLRHVRTGTYAGTELVVRRLGSTFERPRALTECGAKSTGADYGPTSAKSALINGDASEMCQACRAKLEVKGSLDLSHLSDRRGSSSPQQRSYIRRLLDEGARNGRPYIVEARDLDRLSCREASATIDQLKELKRRAWKGDL